MPKKVLVTGRNDLPEKKISVNKDYMLEWLDKYGTLEDVEWYDDVCSKNVTTFKSNLPDTEDTYQTPDWAKVRALFLDRFFENAYPKKVKAIKEKETYEQKLKRMRERKAAEQNQATTEVTPSETPTKSRRK